ncbi:carbon-nitrogen family hydrolase [Caldalkalibacillus salinus]|uniref:carbon-nitrogen family hydrolase n=1 Tax=Caldalkalibacillus salinus TaxID=2803787 RepID=UPI001F437B3B|nr:carbon-nitrogen family hydrolase [Caldalkalibacillus salinus]
MRVGVIQAATQLGKPAENRKRLAQYATQAIDNHVNVLVLPETWNVGFIPQNVRELVQHVDQSDDIQWMKDLAKTQGIYVVGGSIAVREGEDIYNRCYVFNPMGEVIHQYDKVHLFSPGQEATYFTSGTSQGNFEIEGVLCTVQICYDIRFPEGIRGQAIKGAKILFTPAQWPHPRSLHWRTLNQARAIENQMFVVSANGCGVANKIESCGDSAIYDPVGNVLATAENRETLLVGDLDLAQVDDVRSRIPVFKDRQVQTYG